MNSPSQFTLSRMTAALVALLSLFSAAGVSAEQIDGFTEPFLSTNVATVETGVIVSLLAHEGDPVKKGQALALLDNDVHLAILAIAAEQMKAVGRLESAKAELALQQHKLEKIKVLREKGHARQEELERTRADVAIAHAQVLAIQEDLAIRKLEFEKTNLQLERRTIRAPHDGVVTKSQKQEGEFVATNEPVLLTLVQLDPLIATFSVPSAQVVAFRAGQKVQVYLDAAGVRVPGVVDFVSPITDAESGTVRIKVRLENPKGLHRSGERCTLEIPPLSHAVAR